MLASEYAVAYALSVIVRNETSPLITTIYYNVMPYVMETKEM